MAHGGSEEDDATRVTPRPMRGGLEPGTLLNGLYRIEERLGAGGMGEVYRAVNIANDDQDAIKIIGRGLADQTLVEAMFRKEARVLRRIQSPAVAQLRLFARDPVLDVLYFVTEFVDGQSVLDRLRQRPATPDELRQLLARVATGLQAVHEAGAVHRDLSPDNIILPDGDVAHAKLIDFGIVKELDPGQVSIIGDGFAGKFGYIAPEQLGFTGSRIGPWTDIYSLALVGIAFAAGKPSAMGVTMGTADEARREPVDLSPVPPELRPLFARMLTYDWRERASSAAAVLAMLDSGGAPVTVVAPSPPPPPPAPPPAPPPPAPSPPEPPAQAWSNDPSTASPRRWGWGVLVLAVLLLAGIAAGTWWWLRPLPFAMPGVAIEEAGSGLRYQLLDAGSGKARPQPGELAVFRVARRTSGETRPANPALESGVVDVAAMGAGQVEALKRMGRGAHLIAWVPADLRGPADEGLPAGEIVLDMQLIDFGPADSARLQARIAALRAGRDGEADTPVPTPTATPSPLPSATPGTPPLVGPTPTIAVPLPTPTPAIRPTPRPTATARPTPPVEPSSPSCVGLIQQILFDPKQPSFGPESTPALDALVAATARCPGGRVQVDAYADGGGDRLRLAQRRGRSVADYLVGQGVPANRLTLIVHPGSRDSGYGGPPPDRVDVVLRGR